MDSLTQIILGAAVAEAVAGKKMGNKAALWGAVAGTIPDLDVLQNLILNPIDAAIFHRGFSHSILFAVLMGPLLGWLFFHLYKKRYERKLWIQLWFFGIITHPMLDVFTNYGTQFFWPFKERISFNSVFVIDPLYTVPFMICLLVALFLRKDRPARRKWNWTGIIYSSLYLVWGVVVKLSILSSSESYLKSQGLETRNTLVTPMPLTSFYWMILSEDDTNYYFAYKSLFYAFDAKQTVTYKKKNDLAKINGNPNHLAYKLRFFSKGYNSSALENDTLKFYDLRFGVLPAAINQGKNSPIMGFGMVIDNNNVQKTFRIQGVRSFKELNFARYFNLIFSNE
ncbi:MAG: metal-dependent hydrolase [Bacteroidota bacterium]